MLLVVLGSPKMIHPGQDGTCCASRRYGMGQELFSNEEARGGSAWGAGTLANGDGSRQPSKLELDFAEYQVCPPRVVPESDPWMRHQLALPAEMYTLLCTLLVSHSRSEIMACGLVQLYRVAH